MTVEPEEYRRLSYEVYGDNYQAAQDYRDLVGREERDDIRIKAANWVIPRLLEYGYVDRGAELIQTVADFIEQYDEEN